MVPIVSLKNLYYRYPDGTRVLHGISADICKGERVGLVGPNGAGKSTLLLHLNGILGATQGSVEIMGVPLAKGNLKIIRQRVGLVFQDPDDQLFMPTVFDDVAFGPTNAGIVKYEVQMRVQEALQRVGMTGFEERCSHQLSFGEKKKISLATVLSMNLDLLVLDEPASNLDPRARRSLIKLLQGVGTATIISGHDLDLIYATCSRVIVLDEGRVVADGEPLDILANETLMRNHGLEVPLSIRLRELEEKGGSLAQDYPRTQ